MYRRALANVERMISELEREPSEGGIGLLQKEIAFGIGLSETVLSSKLKSVRSHFYEDEFAKLADFFRKKTARPLIGYPHLDWEMMETVDRRVGGWKP
jgi:hypothetical protein